MPALVGGEIWSVIRARIEEIFTAAGTISTNLTASVAAKTAAETAQSGAASSAASASASASSAAGSAGSASASASAASASATAAASSATTAATHMSNASTQATSAAASATAAANIYDAFDDRYLGAKPSNPTLDNDGNTLIVGAIYFNTAVGEMRVWNGAAWLTSFVPSALYMLRAQNLADVADPNAAIANLGITSTAAEINLLHGADATLLPILAKAPAMALAGFDDPIINGSFRLSQRGLLTTTAMGYLADRWLTSGLGGTITTSIQAFAPGDRLGSVEPNGYGRITVSGQTLASHFATKSQRIEDVRRQAGRKITIMGWARRLSGAGNMVISATQNFGTGGTPSASVTVNGKTVTLTGLWAPFAIDLDLPPITGKTLGSAGGSYTEINFTVSAGANFNAAANNLGLQTIGVDLWGVHVREGLVPVAATDLYRQKSPSQDHDEAYRFYENGQLRLQGNGYCATSIQFSTRKRGLPTINYNIVSSGSINTISNSRTDRSLYFNGLATANGGFATIDWEADAEL